MRKTIRALLIAAPFVVAASAASANVMTFTGLSGPIVQPTFVEDGITATSIDGQFWGFPSGDQLHMDPSGFSNSTYDFTMAGLFDLVSFEFSYSGGGTAVVTAYDGSNGVLYTNNFSDALSPVNFFGWTGISRLRIGDTVAHFSIDNLTLAPSEVAAVPEPATWSLLIAGFAGLGLALRSRRQTAKALAR